MTETTTFSLLFISKVRITTPGTASFHEHAEFTYIISGTCNYMIGDTTYVLSEGDYFYIDAYQLHHCTAILSDEPVELFAAGLSCSFLPHGKSAVQHTSPVIRPYLLSLIHTMQQENRQKQPYYKIKLMSCMSEFTVTVLRNQLSDPAPIPMTTSYSYKEQQVQKAALEYIKMHYREPIHLQDIADSIPVSVSHLNRLFQKTMHTSPMQHVIWLRLKHAVSIFDNNPSVSVREVALRSGYSDPFHFSKLFKKHVGVTPTEYLAGKRAKKY